MRISKDFTFDMGHRLPSHEGKCYNLHGHTYKLRVTIQGKPDENGFVMDFGELKKIVKESIIDRLDHSFMLCKDDPITEALISLSESQERPLKFVVMDFKSTAENISRWIFDQLKGAGLPIVEVTLWETPTSAATYGGE